jgi:hypothetical protein
MHHAAIIQTGLDLAEFVLAACASEKPAKALEDRIGGRIPGPEEAK